MKKETSLPSFDLFLLPEVSSSGTLVAGVDEVGRGALFGPVVAAAVVVPAAAMPELLEMGVKDSKQLSAKQRSQLAQQMQCLVSAYHVGYATVAEIDRLNILQASLLAMKRALSGLRIKPELCLVDGGQAIPGLAIAQYNLIKGDLRSPVIAAASIIAKVWRDELIVRWAAKYPLYDLANNKGYGTVKHLSSLQQHGCSPQHRLSFRPCAIHNYRQ